MSGGSLWDEFCELRVLLERYFGQLSQRDFRASTSTIVVVPQHETWVKSSGDLVVFDEMIDRNIYDVCCRMDIQFSNLDELQIHVMSQTVEQNGGLKESKSEANCAPGSREGLLHKTNVVNGDLVDALELNEGNVVAIKNGGVVVMEKDSRALIVGELIEVGASLCVVEESNGESPASFMAPFVAQLSETKPATDSTAIRGRGVDTNNQVENVTPIDNSKETSLHAQGEDVLFIGVIVNVNMKCNEGIVKVKSPIIASAGVMDHANKECNESVVKGKAPRIVSINYNDQFQVDQLTGQSFASKKKFRVLNFTGVVTTDPIRGNSVGTFKPYMQPKEVIDSTLQSIIF
ncbi:hypothetical protein V6N12_062562 [Hibiscus sabdariffa]|uniref:Uncharacterized protein n=1 Tax=Hibiscus sabdariffa TaxID=183260 RepID=A0ABR2F976_9ROSI